MSNIKPIKGLYTFKNMFPLIAGNQRVEIYKNEFFDSENLVYKGDFESFKKTKSEELKKYFSSLVFQFIGTGHCLIIILRKGVISWGAIE